MIVGIVGIVLLLALLALSEKKKNGISFMYVVYFHCVDVVVEIVAVAIAVGTIDFVAALSVLHCI